MGLARCHPLRPIRGLCSRLRDGASVGGDILTTCDFSNEQRDQVTNALLRALTFSDENTGKAKNEFAALAFHHFLGALIEENAIWPSIVGEYNDLADYLFPTSIRREVKN